VATAIWQKIFAPKGSARHLSANHDFILLYAKNSTIWERNLQPRTQQQDERYKNPDNDSRGPWASDNLTARNYYSLGTYPITTPAGRVIEGPPKGTYWRVSKDTFDELDRDNRIWWGETRNNMPRLKRFLAEVQEGVVPQTIWFHQEVGNTQEAKKEVVKLIPDAAEVFSTPKPTRLIQRILQIATNPGDLVLDSFAGSGTTGHAVLQMNAQDGGDRRFILVEMEPKIARDIAAERLRRVIQGRAWTDERGKEHTEAGLGGGFRFCTLDEPLFDARGRIRWGVTFGELARHIFFTETGHPLAGPPEDAGPFIGAHEGVSYFLLWNGTTAGDLDAAALRLLAKHDGRKVVYAALCRVADERLARAGIVYKQIPYSIRTS
jgi:site-specific DNA-methyltransferase (adenine-specific)/adenine-specific DNA-methyltransferase